MTLSFDILEQVAPVIEKGAERLAAQSQALSGCVEKLPTELRDLVRLRYEEGKSLEELAGLLRAVAVGFMR